MTCQEARTHIENGAQTSEPGLWPDARVTEHVVSCAQCSQFVQERQNLGKSLQLLRESAGPVPESLDAAVLAGYRCFLEQRKTAPRLLLWKAFPVAVRWGAIAAALLVAAVIALYSARKTNKTVALPAPQTPATAVVPQNVALQPQSRPARRAVSPARRRSVPSEVQLAMRNVAPTPDDFRGLIYCDELSCNGAMDMIRVQLPSSAIARPTSAFRPTSGPVNADVLIGPDGIARGIRIEEREF